MIGRNGTRFQTPPQNQGNQIKLQDYLNLNLINYNDLCPAFSFISLQDSHCLSSWRQENIRNLIKKLAQLETKKWAEITNEQVFNFRIVTSRKSLKVSVPDEITPETKIIYFQPFGKKNPHRVFGYRERHNFKFLWFDKSHEVYPG